MWNICREFHTSVTQHASFTVPDPAAPPYLHYCALPRLTCPAPPRPALRLHWPVPGLLTHHHKPLSLVSRPSCPASCLLTHLTVGQIAMRCDGWSESVDNNIFGSFPCVPLSHLSAASWVWCDGWVESAFSVSGGHFLLHPELFFSFPCPTSLSSMIHLQAIWQVNHYLVQYSEAKSLFCSCRRQTLIPSVESRFGAKVLLVSPSGTLPCIHLR